jgi:hypothetical protein
MVMKAKSEHWYECPPDQRSPSGLLPPECVNGVRASTRHAVSFSGVADLKNAQALEAARYRVGVIPKVALNIRLKCA